MADVLTPVFAAAALVLALAGAAKLRSPAGAAGALRTLGMPARIPVIRALGLGELILAVACLLAPGVLTAAPLAFLFATFSLVTLVLASRQASCGCFGEAQAPASRLAAVLSASVAAIAFAACFGPPHGVGWMLGRPVSEIAVLIPGIAGAAYAVVIAYTELPGAWDSWSVG